MKVYGNPEQTILVKTYTNARDVMADFPVVSIYNVSCGIGVWYRSMECSVTVHQYNFTVTLETGEKHTNTCTFERKKVHPDSKFLVCKLLFSFIQLATYSYDMCK